MRNWRSSSDWFHAAQAGQHLPEAAARSRALRRGRRCGRRAVQHALARAAVTAANSAILAGRTGTAACSAAASAPPAPSRSLGPRSSAQLLGRRGSGPPPRGLDRLPGELAGSGPDKRDHGKGDEEPGPGYHHCLDDRPVRGRVHYVVQRAGEHGGGDDGPHEHQADGRHRQPRGEVRLDRATGATRRSLTGGTWYPPYGHSCVTSGASKPVRQLGSKSPSFLLLIVRHYDWRDQYEIPDRYLRNLSETARHRPYDH